MLLSILRSFALLSIMVIGFVLIVATGEDDSPKPAPPAPKPSEPTPPQITIHEPNVSFFNEGSNIYFRGEAYDPETKSNLEGSQLIWTSDLVGQIGTGGSFWLNWLSTGTHEITLEARSKSGGTASKTITLSINPHFNTRPEAEILSPADGTYFHINETIIFSGMAEDEEDAMFQPRQLVWKSSRHEKKLGTGFELQIQANTLAEGQHKISLTAWDSQNMPSEPDSITIHITKNHLPEVTIIFPTESNNKFTENDYIIFEGKAWDREDGLLPCTSLKWYSDKHEDAFGNDCLVRSNILSVNEHTITLVAKDSVGGKGTASTTITIIP
ncbi:hypothetical protein LZ24_01560 [Desulfobotulus alkaliphilus]|uniref:Ig-like domain-containing protein n=1 Tax=Desulfobotulus alkaliphilus TaxID=622671 RepID=A0A562RTN2_9BACT|nr:hypothetical protein [Desulfobotulus alkaliphilus]TWI72418.1 hypothetical protein LZ24_01560 [Desulfobotulus alkaliphilus]